MVRVIVNQQETTDIFSCDIAQIDTSKVIFSGSITVAKHSFTTHTKQQKT